MRTWALRWTGFCGCGCERARPDSWNFVYKFYSESYYGFPTLARFLAEGEDAGPSTLEASLVSQPTSTPRSGSLAFRPSGRFSGSPLSLRGEG